MEWISDSTAGGRGKLFEKGAPFVGKREPKGSHFIFEKEEENSLTQRKFLYESSAILKLEALTLIAATVTVHFKC